MKKKYLITITLFAAVLMTFLFIRNANPLYLSGNHNIDKIVIDDIYNSENSITITDKNEINQLVSCFSNYNLRKNKAEMIDSILQYKMSFYENDTLIVYIEMDISEKENNWGYNICRIYTIYEHKYFKLPDSFIETVKNLVYSQ
jgi:hypothetical protein